MSEAKEWKERNDYSLKKAIENDRVAIEAADMGDMREARRQGLVDGGSSRGCLASFSHATRGLIEHEVEETWFLMCLVLIDACLAAVTKACGDMAHNLKKICHDQQKLK